jgi:hypothetical protein
MIQYDVVQLMIHYQHVYQHFVDQLVDIVIQYLIVMNDVVQMLHLQVHLYQNQHVKYGGKNILHLFVLV